MSIAVGSKSFVDGIRDKLQPRPTCRNVKEVGKHYELKEQETAYNSQFFPEKADLSTDNVCNQDNQVRDNYRAALSWFFLKYHGKFAWADYLAWQWRADVCSRKVWENQSKFCLEFEGEGGVLEWSYLVVLAFLGRISSGLKSPTHSKLMRAQPDDSSGPIK